MEDKRKYTCEGALLSLKKDISVLSMAILEQQSQGMICPDTISKLEKLSKEITP